jgi:predicted NACHT family NTPase
MIFRMLTFLCHGLSTERQRVAGEITDLLDRYQKCRAVITCRNAVYHEEFAEQTERKLEIMELNDQQVRRFLQSWESEMPVGRSVEALVRTLRDRPRIMALARNPLLLTIIAYLYTDTEYILPHSRAEFYRQSTDFLLGQLHPERNQFEARAKRQVLQHLALFNQDSTSQLHQDRRSMEYTAVLAELRVILPNLNLDPEQASIPLLNEIVERSGLLLAVDGGESYQFAHLTLQEYFAAARLIGDSAGLVERFKNNKDGWREVVKLWCGLDVDSTDLIRSIYSVDPITALECLADGQKVEPDLADQIIAASKLHLTNDDGQGLIAQAFASIASDSRPRGAAVLTFLQAKSFK